MKEAEHVDRGYKVLMVNLQLGGKGKMHDWNRERYKFENLEEFITRLRKILPKLKEEEKASLSKFLVTLLDEPDRKLVNQITEILKEIGKYAISELIYALRDDKKRLQAAIILANVNGDEVVERLVRLLEDGNDEFVVWAAVWTLGEIGDRRALPSLYKLLQNADTFFFAATVEDAISKIEKKAGEMTQS